MRRLARRLDCEHAAERIFVLQPDLLLPVRLNHLLVRTAGL